MTDSRLALRRALSLARKGRYRVAPNPRVGAVVVRDDGSPGGRVVGEGFHARAGGPHAEVAALAAAGERARGASLYVTLEPCTHRGRTPPCTEAILAAGIARLVACHRDPDPEVAGGGFALLRRAGVEVEHGLLVEPAVRLNLAFLTAALHRRPAVTLKWAMSLDGKIATAGGDSRWISSPAARRWALDLREEHDAIVVGSGTVLADDPLLTRRPPPGVPGRAESPIVRVVLDRRLRLSPSARLFEQPGPVLIYTRVVSDTGARRLALEAAGAEVIELHPDALEPEGRTAPGAEIPGVVADLWQRGIRSVLVEGGGEIHSAFVAAGLWDRVLVDLGPLLVGGRAAPGPLGGEGLAVLASAPRLDPVEVRRRGGDVLIEGFRPGCLQALCSSVDG